MKPETKTKDVEIPQHHASLLSMYDVDEKDSVQEIKSVPAPCAGAPLPLVLCDESNLFLAYLVSDSARHWKNVPTCVNNTSSCRELAVVRFRRPYAHMFGPPNDEAFSGHPLYARGLLPYGVYEVAESSWIRRLERMNSVHPRHHRASFLQSRRHLIFSFHDSTFECIAEYFEWETLLGSMKDALDTITIALGETWQ